MTVNMTKTDPGTVRVPIEFDDESFLIEDGGELVQRARAVVGPGTAVEAVVVYEPTEDDSAAVAALEEAGFTIATDERGELLAVVSAADLRGDSDEDSDEDGAGMGPHPLQSGIGGRGKSIGLPGTASETETDHPAPRTASDVLDDAASASGGVREGNTVTRGMYAVSVDDMRRDAGGGEDEWVRLRSFILFPDTDVPHLFLDTTVPVHGAVALAVAMLAESTGGGE